MNTKTNSLPNGDFIEKYANEILDIQVGQTDMRVRHIFKKFVEVCVFFSSLPNFLKQMSKR